MEMPQSPRTQWDSQDVYWLNPDLSRPSWRLILAQSAAVSRAFPAQIAFGFALIFTT